MTLLYSDDLADLIEDTPQRYALGPAAAPLLLFNAADAHGVMWVCEEPQGWDAAEVDTPLDDAPHGHGGYAGESTLEARTLTFAGSAEAPSIADAHRARKRLLAAVLSSLGGWVEYWHLDDDPPKALWLRPAGRPRVELDGRWLDFQFVMVAEDPIKHGAVAEYGPIGVRSDDAGGVTGPWSGALSSATLGQLDPVLSIDNAGDEWGHARYTVVGPLRRPIVTLRTGEFVGLTIDLGDDDTFVVDTRAGTLMVNGVSRYDAILPGSTLPMIPPEGGTDARLGSGTSDDNPDAELYVTTAPAWK